MSSPRTGYVASRSSIAIAKEAIMEYIVRENGLLTAFSALTSLQQRKSSSTSTLPPLLFKLALTTPRGMDPTVFVCDLVKYVNFQLARAGETKARISFVANSPTCQFFSVYIGPYSNRVEIATLSAFPSMPFLPPDIPLEDISWSVPVRVNGSSKVWEPLQLLPPLLEQTLRDVNCNRVANDIRTTVLGTGTTPLGVTLPWNKLAKLAPFMPVNAMHLVPDTVRLMTKEDPATTLAAQPADLIQTNSFTSVPACVHDLPAGVEILSEPLKPIDSTPMLEPPPPPVSAIATIEAAAAYSSDAQNVQLERIKQAVSTTCIDAVSQLADMLLRFDRLPYIAVACAYELDMRALANLHTFALQLFDPRVMSAMNAFIQASIRAPSLRPGLWTLFLLPFVMLSSACPAPDMAF